MARLVDLNVIADSKQSKKKICTSFGMAFVGAVVNAQTYVTMSAILVRLN